MSIPTCPTCDNPMVYAGVDDGGGDYGTAVCDVWTCQNCMQDVEMNCVETEEEDDDTARRDWEYDLYKRLDAEDRAEHEDE